MFRVGYFLFVVRGFCSPEQLYRLIYYSLFIIYCLLFNIHYFDCKQNKMLRVGYFLFVVRGFSSPEQVYRMIYAIIKHAKSCLPEIYWTAECIVIQKKNLIILGGIRQSWNSFISLNTRGQIRLAYTWTWTCMEKIDYYDALEMRNLDWEKQFVWYNN